MYRSFRLDVYVEKGVVFRDKSGVSVVTFAIEQHARGQQGDAFVIAFALQQSWSACRSAHAICIRTSAAGTVWTVVRRIPSTRHS